MDEWKLTPSSKTNIIDTMMPQMKHIDIFETLTLVMGPNQGRTHAGRPNYVYQNLGAPCSK
jgi:hypothetical protein